MKFPILLTALLTALFTTLFAFAPAGEAAQRVRPAAGADPDRPKIDVESYTIDATINSEERSLRATAEIRFRQLDQNSFAAFDLDRRLRVSNVTIAGERIGFRQFDRNSSVEIDLSGRPASEDLTVRIDYSGRLDPDDLDPADRDPGLLRISDRSALLLYEGKWYPTNGTFSDKATMVLHVTVPNGWTPVTDVPSAGTGYATFTPSFWGLLAAGPYKTDELKTTRATVDVHTLNADSAGARYLQVSSARILDFYSSTFGFPQFPVFHIVEVDGVSWTSRSSPGVLILAASRFRSDFDEASLARILAEQWFPMKIAVARPADSWLADGMAEFASLMYLEKKLAPSEFQVQADKALVKALAYEGRMTTLQAGDLPKDTIEYHALVEYKGAYILRMLRWVMGDSKFSDLMGRYVEAFRDTPASTEAFIRLASTVQGEDLNYFFEQWLSAWGAPEFETEYTVFRTPDGYLVRGTVKQNLDLFRMPVELEIVTDGEPEYERVELAGVSSEFQIATVRKPREIQVDPEKKILRISPGIRLDVAIGRGEEYANEDRLDDAIREYQRAIDMNPKSSLALFRLGEALFEEGNLQFASQQFRDALNGDLKPAWVEVWCHINLGKIYDIRGFRDRAIAAYQQAVNTGNDSYGAQAEAKQYLTAPFRGSATALRN
ncbi:MAG TPA: M1 family aminopeptidase [Terriglobia bacterium]|nr:M1 family aminopeptidase [Terriglobia bacterium]